MSLKMVLLPVVLALAAAGCVSEKAQSTVSSSVKAPRTDNLVDVKRVMLEAAIEYESDPELKKLELELVEYCNEPSNRRNESCLVHGYYRRLSDSAQCVYFWEKRDAKGYQQCTEGVYEAGLKLIALVGQTVNAEGSVLNRCVFDNVLPYSRLPFEYATAELVYKSLEKKLDRLVLPYRAYATLNLDLLPLDKIRVYECVRESM